MARDPGTIDWQREPIRLADDVKVWPVRENGKPIYRLEIPTTHQFFRVGFAEYTFLSALDGKRTLAQACGLVTARMGREAPTSSQCESIARWLIENRLAHFADSPSPSRGARSVLTDAAGSKNDSIWTRWNPFWIKTPIPGAASALRILAEPLRFLFAVPTVLAGLLLIAVALFGLLTNRHEFLLGASSILDPSNWNWLLLTLVSLKFVHELGHSIAAYRVGGSVREAGVVWVLMAPLAYVDVTSCWRLPSKWSRMGVAAAGMFVECVIASVAALTWLTSDNELLRWWCHHVVLSAGLSTLLFNANVLMRFDGYFILSDALGIPNLASESDQSVRHWFRRWFLGEIQAESSYRSWRRWTILGYGFAAKGWRVLVCISLGIASSTLMGGTGIVLTALGIWLWWGRPLVSGLRSTRMLAAREPLVFARAALLVSLAAVVVGWACLSMPIPTSVRVPVVVQYDPDTAVRAGVEGFLRELHVEEGEWVRAGQHLATIENRELSQRVAELQIAQEQNEIRLRKAIDTADESTRLILLENRTAIIEKLATLEKQTAGLRVVATRSGQVIANDLSAKRGTYLREGDSIMVVASDADKEVLAMIDQSQIEDVRNQIGGSIRLSSADRSVHWAQLETIQPRATDRIPHASLAATHGGSLTVRLDDETEEDSIMDDVLGQAQVESMRLLHPHFRGVLRLEDSSAEKLPVGMRLDAYFGWHQASLVTRIQRWFQKALADAEDRRS
ncbi:efflux RND transporter periplasmic adaptor subunit [Rhodopirellula halodulae]|uniref:efflux RND transporter periplasmic adaptor subunit n=1 Tax=Rhodopirellula halodulae TaxID=2894198 RepID=UPI001E29896C|nr:efflux RND transporter periplasmic adaptor subunit [Rhodopirellula sp. JC737]MCC9654989.1 efflux RND transporter periplasmic adaptor subunit [Rhodopirellula sp. JC737]